MKITGEKKLDRLIKEFLKAIRKEKVRYAELSLTVEKEIPGGFCATGFIVNMDDVT